MLEGIGVCILFVVTVVMGACAVSVLPEQGMETEINI